jgi:hypothetical protein
MAGTTLTKKKYMKAEKKTTNQMFIYLFFISICDFYFQYIKLFKILLLMFFMIILAAEF